MNQKNNKTNKSNPLFKSPLMIVLAAAVVITAAVMFTRNGQDSASPGTTEDIVITKNMITDTVQFLPAKVGKTNLEVMAVKASDGTIRTAFNTCQVCNGSPRAYYKQEGDVVVCQNCGNRFSMDMIEVQRGGCNPIPIMPDEKIDNGDTITIPGDYIAQNSNLFTANWKSQ
jgi:hypothetical protein